MLHRRDIWLDLEGKGKFGGKHAEPKQQEQELLSVFLAGGISSLLRQSYFVVQAGFAGLPSCLSLPGLWLQACVSTLDWAEVLDMKLFLSPLPLTLLCLKDWIR